MTGERRCDSAFDSLMPGFSGVWSWGRWNAGQARAMTDFAAHITEILADCAPDCLVWLDEAIPLIALAAEQHYRPVIETAEQLDALPVGQVIVDDDLNVCERLGVWDEESGELYGLMWGTVGIAAPVMPELPAIIVWSPGAGEC